MVMEIDAGALPVDGDALLLAIAPDNATVHVGPANLMAGHVSLGLHAATAKLRAPLPLPTLELFDESGRRLTPVWVGGQLTFTLDPTQAPTDEQLLLDRIDAALAQLQVQQDLKPLPNGPADGRVPRPVGSLPEVIGKLAVEFDFLSPAPNRGNWLHQLAHAAGTAH
jgi:hypothetical protein